MCQAPEYGKRLSTILQLANHGGKVDRRLRICYGLLVDVVAQEIHGALASML